MPISEVYRLIREKQVRTIQVNDELLLNKEQFNLFMKEMEKQKEALEEYLNTPIPEDIDIKDED